MESKFLLALLVAAFLPGPSHQILTKTCGGQGYQNDDILLVNELSENARYAATNDGQSYDPYNKEYTDFFADVSAANSNSEVAYAFFSNDIPDNFILKGDWVQASSVVTPTTGWDKTAGRAGLLSGLQTIRKNVNKRGNGKTMKVAVVFASPMINGFVRNVSNEITSAESIGISIYLFAVGDAGLNPNLNNLIAELAKSGLNNRVFRVANNLNIADLGQLLTNQLLDCNSPAPVTTQPPPPPPPPTTTTPPTTQTRCEECLLTDGAPHITHETRCDWYYHCHRNGTLIISTRKQCPHGTLFDKSQRGCDWAEKVLSKTANKSGCNWCRVFQHNGTIERYPYQDSCAAYLECFRNDTKTQLVGKCCRQGFYFDGNGCFPNAARCDGLRYRSHAHGSYCRTYYQCDSGTNFEEKCCPSGTGFNKTLGECVNRADCANISCKEPPTTLSFGTWRAWGQWTPNCPTCASNPIINQVRTRVCDRRPSQLQCPGVSQEVRTFDCNIPQCTGTWLTWGAWSLPNCQACGLGIRRDIQRTRGCNSQFGQNGCVGQRVQTDNAPCNISNCIGTWGTWAQWTTPNCPSCGPANTRGAATRSRACIKVNPLTDNDCPGFNTATRLDTCSIPLCPFGTWDQWSTWGPVCPIPCSPTQLRLTQTRNRQCFKAQPTDRDCQGLSSGVKTVDCDVCSAGQWEQWGTWSSNCPSACSTTFQQVTDTRTRQCNRGSGVTDCVGLSFDTKTTTCTQCTAEWETWGQWSQPNCPDCGLDQIRPVTRSRICDPNPGQPFCVGSSTSSENRRCDIANCTGVWSTWTSWSLPGCPTCGVNIQRGVSRTRLCVKANPSDDDCSGSDVANRVVICNISPCGPGVWSVWSVWSPVCPVCGDNVRRNQVRRRTCSRTSSATPCVGSPTDRRSHLCNIPKCPDEPGTWGTWAQWTTPNCPSCGPANTRRAATRSRECIKVNSLTDDDCPGTIIDTRLDTCNSPLCPFGAWDQWSTWGPVCPISCSPTQLRLTQTRNRQCFKAQPTDRDCQGLSSGVKTIDCDVCSDKGIDVTGPAAVLVGRGTVLTCIISELDGADAISWFHEANGSSFVLCDNNQSKMSVDGADIKRNISLDYDCEFIVYPLVDEAVSVLSLRNISFEGEGNFSCIHGNRQSSSKTLKVYKEETPKPTIMENDKVRKIPELSPITLTCATDPSFSKVQVAWQMNSSAISTGVNTYQVINDNGSVSVRSTMTTKATMEMNGAMFKCVVFNVLTPEITKETVYAVTVVVTGPDNTPNCVLVGVVAGVGGVSLPPVVCALTAFALSRRRAQARMRREGGNQGQERRQGGVEDERGRVGHERDEEPRRKIQRDGDDHSPKMVPV